MDSEAKDKKDVPWLRSCRVVLALVSFLGFANLYALRVNMSVAMVCMINQTALQINRDELANGETYNSSSSSAATNFTVDVSVSQVDIGQCSGNIGDSNTTGKTNEDGEFDWNKSTQGLVLGAFFWGYLITQIPGGWIAAKFGGKRVFGWCMFTCALSTLLMPVAARVSPIFLMVLRFIAGLGQGVVWPAMHAVWAYWSPPLERSKLIGFSFAGAQMGNVLTFPIAGLLCKYGFDNGWPSIFYVLGAFGVLWFILWMLLAYDTPEDHPRVTEVEKRYIQDSLVGETSKTIDRNVSVPWLSILTSGPVWAIVVCHTCGNWTVYTFLTNMPTFMKEVLHFDIKSNGFVSAVPYIGMWAMTIISGFVADALRTRDILGTTNVRKLNNIIGMIVPAILCVILGFIDCTQWLVAVILIIFSVSLLGCVYGAGYVVNHADIAPKYASLLFGISNTTASIPGFMAPYVIGLLTKNQTQHEWRMVFFIAAAVSSFGSLFYLVFGSGDVQPWARDESSSTTDDAEKEKEKPPVSLAHEENTHL